MGLRILTDSDQGYQILYCSTSMTAFGPVHGNDEFDLQDFVEWLPMDARKYGQVELDKLYWQWHQEKGREIIQEENEAL